MKSDRCSLDQGWTQGGWRHRPRSVTIVSRMLGWLVILAALAVALYIFWTVVRDLWRRARQSRRVAELEQGVARLQKDLLALPGGSPDNPIDIDTPAVVEPIAEKERCAVCGGELLVEEHTAEKRGDVSLRIAKVRCLRCGATRDIYFRLLRSLLN